MDALPYISLYPEQWSSRSQDVISYLALIYISLMFLVSLTVVTKTRFCYVLYKQHRVFREKTAEEYAQKQHVVPIFGCDIAYPKFSAFELNKISLHIASVITKMVVVLVLDMQ